MSKKNTPTFVELTIINSAGSASPISTNSLYISLYAGSTPYAIDATTGICTAGIAGMNATPVLLSSLTSQVLKFDSTSQMASGRLYFSSSDTVIGSGGPSITDCPDYFDWLEFTLNGPSADSRQFVINTTQVDQFGFPITISGMTPADPSFGDTAGTVSGIKRSKIISDFKSNTSKYLDCVLPNKAATGKPNLRILSPGNAIVNKPTSALGSVFNDSLKKFFMQTPYEAKTGQLIVRTPLYINSVGGYAYEGILTTVAEKGTDGETHNYPVLQFNFADDSVAPNPLGIDKTPKTGTGPYNIYFPFFNTNAGSNFPPPPIWWKTPTKKDIPSLPKESTPSQMLFAASGIFADNAFQLNSAGNAYTTVQQQIIGNLENQLNVAFNRGYANSILWKTLTGTIAPSGTAANSIGLYETTVTLGAPFKAQDLPNTTVNLKVGMQVLSYASSQPLEISEINADGTSFKVTSAKEILAQNPQYLTFSNFYEGIDAENLYAKFFHKSTISVDGRAYAMPFDDQGGFSSTLTSNWAAGGTPTKLTITLGEW